MIEPYSIKAMDSWRLCGLCVLLCMGAHTSSAYGQAVPAVRPSSSSGAALHADADQSITTLIGEVLLVKGAPARSQVVLHHGDQDTPLLGPLHDELAHVQSMRVEVIGRVHGENNIWVLGYRIIDIGGGAQPLVGILIAIGHEFALQDGDGAPIVLSASPRYRKKLALDVGAKIWVHGKKLLSGSLHVMRYGVLRRNDWEQPTPVPTVEATTATTIESTQKGDDDHGTYNANNPIRQRAPK